MGALDDLAAALYGQQVQKAIAADNNYTQLAQVPDAISGLITNAAVQTPGKYDTKDIILGALLSGTTSGLLSGAGENYQNVLTKRYQDSAISAAQGNEPTNEGLSPSLFKAAKDTGSMFRAKQAAETRDLLQRATLQDPVKAEMAKQLHPELYGLPGSQPAENPSQSKNQDAIKAQVDDLIQNYGGDEVRQRQAKGAKIEKTQKDKDTQIAAQQGIDDIDRLINLSSGLPSSMSGRFIEGISPLTNNTNKFDDYSTSVAGSLAKLKEGRVNETVLKMYQDSMARQPGDSPADIKERLVNAQLWLNRIAQGDMKAMNMDPAEFAAARGVEPSKIGISGGSTTPTSSTLPSVGSTFNGEKVLSIKKISK